MPVEFDQSNDFNKKFEKVLASKKDSKMNTFLIKHYIAKDEKQANIILLGISAIFLVLTFFVFYTFVFGNGFKSASNSSQNAKVIEEYRKQGLKGKALLDKMQADRKAGIIK